MKKYFKYMDDRKVSDTLHHRLLNLETPKKRPAAWKKYGAAAAALVLVAGLGAWGLSRGGWDAVTENFRPNSAIAEPETADIGQPDIAVVEPEGNEEPGMKTIGGYEVRGPENGPNTVVSYFMLPYIEYGMTKETADVALDWDVPPGSTKRDLTQADFAALFGGEENLSVHLGWEGYTLTGWAAWYADGTLWGAFINGNRGEHERFEFAFITGNQYPPTCIGYGEGVVNELWDVPVTAWGFDGAGNYGRRVEFLTGGCGFRFDLTSTDAEQAALLVSRLVRWVIPDGVRTDALSSDGAVLVHPWEADPNYSIGEPNWEDGVSDYDSDCPYCADGTAHTHPYDPQEALDPSYNAPD